MVAIAETTEAGSKSRAEFCKQAKALAKFADLRGIKELEAVTTKYKPKVRALPDEETLFELAKTLRHEDPFGWIPFTPPFNLTGQPAASIPCGFDSNSLPIGLQIVGPMYGDSVVLNVSRAFERAHPFAHKRPVLSL